MTIDSPVDAAPVSAPANTLLTSPILPTLLRLALPNAVAMVGIALVTVAETSYIGRLGTEPLAGLALVFPVAMLTQMMSAGAMGGGVSPAITRARGAGGRDGRRRLLRDQPGAGRRRSRPRGYAGAARGHDRGVRRVVLHGNDAAV